MIIRIVKLVVDTVIHGYALHTVYGCSLHLLGALWSSLANLVLHLARESAPKKPGNDSGDNQPTAHNSTGNTESTAPPAVIVQQPLPTRPPRTKRPCHKNKEDAQNVNTHMLYSKLRDRLNSLEEIV